MDEEDTSEGGERIVWQEMIKKRKIRTRGG
jgi:hypothetical protein